VDQATGILTTHPATEIPYERKNPEFIPFQVVVLELKQGYTEAATLSNAGPLTLGPNPACPRHRRVAFPRGLLQGMGVEWNGELRLAATGKG